MSNRYEDVLKRRDRFRAWSSIGVIAGFYGVLYISMDLHGVQGAALGMAYSASVGWCLWREREFKREAEAVYKEWSDAKAAGVPKVE